MSTLLKKLNFKDQKSILVLNAPVAYPETMIDFDSYLEVKNELRSEPVEFALTFCARLEEIEKFAPAIDKDLVEDGLLWFAYPKGSSKKYKCEFNRDNGWGALGKLGYEPVRQIAIDEDWSALRFRKVKNIKTMTRNAGMVLSEEGKERLKKK